MILRFDDMVDSALRIDDTQDNILAGPPKAAVNDET